MSAILIVKENATGQVYVRIPRLVECGVSILQNVEDEIIFMEHNLEKTLNMKLIICIFE